jgi:tRNA threonylcarbamoyladenosine modification (KEOPS) complex  Pcc1 subunit
MDMKGNCVLKIEFATPAAAKAAHASLKQEEEFKKRSESQVSQVGSFLLIEIKAEDVVALRATANSYLRALQTLESIKLEIDD